jgi:hypothetical protein
MLSTVVSIFGDGTIKINPYDGFAYHTLQLNASDLIIDGITVDGNNSVIGIYNYAGSRNIIRNCTVKNCKLAGISNDGSRGGHGTQIINNHVYNVVKSGEIADGIYTQQSDNVIIR